MKIAVLLIIGLSLGAVLYSNAGLPEYHQDDYDFKFERAEVVWYNNSFMRDVHITFPFYNRTQRVMNATLYLVIDQTNDLVFEVQGYKFASNEYRFFPVTVSVNLCEEYARNNFNIQTILKNISNATPCPLKKGFYYMYNFMPDFSRLPPFIPRGKYKAVGKLYHRKAFVVEAHCYAEIVDKATKWWK